MNGITTFLRVLSVFLCLSAMLELSAQEIDEGKLGVFSRARINLSFEITDRLDPDSQQVAVGAGVATIPGYLQGKLAEALVEDGKIEFPVCLAYSREKEMTVSVDSEESSEWMLEGLNGEKIPYSVSIRGNLGKGSGNDKKVQYTQPDLRTCDMNNALKVNITLTEELPQEGAVYLRGQFRLVISAE